MSPNLLDVKGVPFDPNFFDHLFFIIYLMKVLKKGSPKIRVLTLKPFRPQMSKKTAFFEDFWQIFFHFSKSHFFGQIHEMRAQKRQKKKAFFYSKTHQYIPEKVRPQKCKKCLKTCILTWVWSHRNTQSHQYDTWKQEMMQISWVQLKVSSQHFSWKINSYLHNTLKFYEQK